MYFKEDSLDDLMHEAMQKILSSGTKVTATKGDTIECAGALLVLTNPRARLSQTESKGTFFSCFGELFWYLSKSNKLDFIQYYIDIYKKYSDDQEILNGAYGPRIFGNGELIAQFAKVKEILIAKPTSRQAVIQIFDATDIQHTTLDVPCTCTLQFLIRDGKLILITNMRSNDLYRGFPHDVFALTMIQEMMARSLGIEIGGYMHFVGSLHIYEDDRPNINRYLKEGWPESKPMPPMPQKDPFKELEAILAVEKSIRLSGVLNLDSSIDSYWKDIFRVLYIFNLYKTKDKSKLEEAKAVEASLDDKQSIYKQYTKKFISRIEKLQ